MNTDTTPALEVRGLTKVFRSGGALTGGQVRALTDVDLSVGRQEIVALVGESGSGKSTLARCVAQLERPTAGEILLDGRPVGRVRGLSQRRAYYRQVQMIFQDPFGSLNPVHRIDHFLRRAVEINKTAGKDVDAKLVSLMETVGLDADMLDSYPFELSGGQRQRIAIARALAVDPTVVLADEPTSMLDVSVRIGVLNLMRRLRDEQGISMLYITHDLASARYLADRIAVMFAGQIVEQGESVELLANPLHPYTRLLVSAVPDADRRQAYDPVLRAELRRQVLAAASCPFDGDREHPCSTTKPVHHRVDDDHWVRCHLYRPLVQGAAAASLALPDGETVGFSA
ncbi:MAG TPA: ATP-binding cassette domain-containing protein [Candidatus Luteococcus avicola]|nr:ATP-binding cassette domain-containing protein [Candidatus Luteococcus avicola]